MLKSLRVIFRGIIIIWIEIRNKARLKLKSLDLILAVIFLSVGVHYFQNSILDTLGIVVQVCCAKTKHSMYRCIVVGRLCII